MTISIKTHGRESLLYYRPWSELPLFRILHTPNAKSNASTRAGCLLLTGSTTSFHLQPVHRREQILLNWAGSYLPPLRQTYRSLTSIFKSIWVKTSPTIGPVVGFPRVPVHGKLGVGFEYDFLQFPPGSGEEVIETDVVVVGSGCGGAVVAKNLTEAGNRVIVVDKGYHYRPEHLPMTEADAGIHLFMNGGLESSDDNSIVVIAGQTWGGGGTVNWSASLQTQGFVRKEWADAGLPFFTSSEYQNSLDRVCQRMGVSAEHIEHNKANRIVLEGARKLGYSCKAVPQVSCLLEPTPSNVWYFIKSVLTFYRILAVISITVDTVHRAATPSKSKVP